MNDHFLFGLQNPSPHLAVVLSFVLKHFLDVQAEGEVTLGEMMAEFLHA